MSCLPDPENCRIFAIQNRNKGNMVYFFSGTGNSQHVAHEIAAALHEEVASITDCMKKRQFSPTIKEGESVGIVCATHFWGLPALVEEFLKKVEIPWGHYVYLVATYGTTTGQIGHFAKKTLSKRDISLDASFSVKMPDVWTPIFNLSDKEKADRQNKKADEELLQVISRIQQREKGNFMRHRIPLLLSFVYHLTYGSQRKTSHFHVESSCAGCGQCARNCPVEAIYISDGKPMWTKDQCTMCLHCLHSCPKFAIQYGSQTRKHGQYLHPVRR